MTPRIKKLVGTVLLLVVLAIYSLLVAVAASAVLTGNNKIVEMFFYAIAGIAWVLPAGYLIRWMYTPPRPSR
jgi:Na+-driven multidrug efflux pump